MNSQDSSILKSLEQKANRIAAEINQHNSVADEYIEKARSASKQLSSIRREIKKLKDSSKGLIVSEHAMLRYLERKMDVSPDEIKEVILTDQLKATYKALGDGAHPTGAGIRAVIKDGVIVTMK